MMRSPSLRLRYRDAARQRDSQAGTQTAEVRARKPLFHGENLTELSIVTEFKFRIGPSQCQPLSGKPASELPYPSPRP
eukprot:1144643-Rhodomonas_salina.1